MKTAQIFLAAHALLTVIYCIYSVINVNIVLAIDDVIKYIFLVSGVFFDLFAFIDIDIYLEMKDENILNKDI